MDSERLEQREAQKQAIVDKALASSIGTMNKILARTAFAQDIIINYIDRRLKRLGGTFDKEMKQTLNRYGKLLRDADILYDKVFKDMLEKACREEGKPFNVSLYDDIRRNANEVVRLMMLYYDRAYNAENYRRIFEFLFSLPSGHFFTEEEINRFSI